MPAGNSVSTAKPTKGKQRPSKKKQDTQQTPPQPDPMAHSLPLQEQTQFFHQPTIEQSHYHPQPGQAQGAPSTTPSRKRQGRNNKHNARNGYHSDTGTTHYGQGPRHHSVSQSVDVGHLYSASPAASSAGQVYGVTPPRATTSTPTKQQVYAGPTFLASPAASSLPMPKSLAKTMPPSSRHDILPSRQEADQGPNDATFGSPARMQAAAQGREGSPLEMLFSADRAEKSWKASESASPLSQVRSASREGAGSARRDRPQGRRSGTPGSASNKEIFMMEMNGNNDDSESEEPVKAVPFRERMQAIAEAESPTTQQPTPSDGSDLQRQAKTRALKQLLMGPGSEQQQLGSTTQHVPRGHYGHAGDYMHQGQAQQQWGATGHTTMHPGRASEDKHQSVRPPAASPSPQDLRAMEENLRRVLKLGPAS